MARQNKKRHLHSKIIKKVLSNLGEYWSELNTEHCKELYNLVKDSILLSESNSAVICGPPECGKTTVS